MTQPTERALAPDERVFERLFARGSTELADDGFSAAVVARVRTLRRRRVVRAAVIGTAAAVGLAFALEPLADLVRFVGGASGDSLRWIEMYRAPLLVAALGMLGWPALARWVAS
jgi:hypothetical protein